MSLLENIQKRGFKDILNPNKWRIFTIWILKRMLAYLSKSSDQEVSQEAQKVTRLYTKSELEQIILRIRKCRECYERGTCIKCGCDAVGEMQEPTTKCADGKWKAFISADKWESYKQKVNFKI